MEYPKVRYAKGKDPILVVSAEEEAALGPGWYDNPAQVEDLPPVRNESRGDTNTVLGVRKTGNPAAVAPIGAPEGKPSK